MPEPSVVIIGAGNVATHLAVGLAHAGVKVSAVASRTLASANALAAKVGNGCHAVEISSGRQLPDAGVYIFSVPDNALADLVENVHLPQGRIAAHTSGTLDKELLKPLTPHCGVFYPLQTFSKDAPVDISRVPFFIEGADEKTAQTLTGLAQCLSQHVHATSPQQRQQLHIAGVMCCNFPTILWEATEKILAEAGYPLDVVKPLIQETMAKCFAIGPHAAQTGPARRHDTEVIQKHLASLPEQYRPAYKALTEMILQSHR